MVKSWIFTAIDLDFILGWGTKIPKTIVVQPKKKKKQKIWASQVALVVKNPPANVGDIKDSGSIPGLGR